MWAGFRDGMPRALNLTLCEYLSTLLEDAIHPAPVTTALMGEALVSLLRAAIAVKSPSAPYTAMPTAPLAPDARASPLSTCTYARDLPLDADGHGWAHVEGEEIVDHATNVSHNNNKPGLLATTAGASMTMVLRTRFPRLPHAALVQLVVVYLGSYEHMGDAVLSCVSDCSCEQTLLRGSLEELISWRSRRQ